MRSFKVIKRSKCNFLKDKCMHSISCGTEQISGLLLNLKCKTHQEVNFGSSKVILRSFGGHSAVLFLRDQCGSMHKLLN